ncbi:MAG TPA: nuclear transport factor 2 family protein [Kofleriaceae bacterium]
MKRAWIASVIAASGCVDAPEAPETTATDSSALSASEASKAVFERLLQATEADRSYRASRDGFVATIGAFAADGLVYSEANHGLVRGKAAVGALLDGDDPGHARRATFDPRRITVSADGLLGTTFGWNTFTTRAADGSITTAYGSYTTMWRRTGLRWTELVHVANALDVAPTSQPAGFPLLDPGTPVIRLAAPAATAAEIAAADLAFAAASVAQGGAIAIPAYEAPGAGVAEAIYGGVFYGHDQVAAAHAGDLPPPVLTLDWAPSDVQATFTGDLGYTDGVYVVRLTSSGAAVAQGTYLTIYQRQPDGGWKFTVANSNPSPVTEP